MLKIIYSFVLHLSIVRSCLILLDIKGARGVTLFVYTSPRELLEDQL